MPSPADKLRLPSGVTIRPADPVDAEGISRVVTRALRITNAADYAPDIIDRIAVNFTPERVTTRMAGRLVLVALRNGDIIGTASLDGDVVRTVFIDPDHQGAGIGATLMHEVEMRALQASITALTVPSSITAQSFYTRLGYAPVREEFHGDERTIIMSRH
jgi:GNAT superfamily N-acetyltransferase